MATAPSLPFQFPKFDWSTLSPINDGQYWKYRIFLVPLVVGGMVVAVGAFCVPSASRKKPTRIPAAK